MKPKNVAPLLILLFIVGTLSITISPKAQAHTAADPFVTDLIAAQTIDVGEVLVWNDGDTLFVRYETDGDWVLADTHVAVATTLGGIPQTKNGNPIPGQFEFSTNHSPSVNGFTYEIDLDWADGTLLYIAAHAGVCGPGANGPIPAEGIIRTITLYAWATAFNVGNVTVAVSGGNLIVTFNAASGWLLLDTHLYVSTVPPPLVPDFTTFPNQHLGLGGVATDTFTLSISGLGLPTNTPIYISAHANLRYVPFGTLWQAWADENPFDGWTKSFSVIIPSVTVCETAWGNGLRFVDTTWAMYFTYTVQ